jgi:hypothetical protein
MTREEKINEIIRLMNYNYGKHYVTTELVLSLHKATDSQLDGVLDWQQNKKYRQPTHSDFKKGFTFEIYNESTGYWIKMKCNSDKHPTDYSDYVTEEELNNPNKYRVEL